MNKTKLVRRKLPELHPEFSNDIPTLLQRIYALRGVTSSKEIDYAARNLSNYDQLNGIDKAVEIIYSAMKNNQRIMIVGDFDTDGATSTALAVRALKQMGCQFVDYIIPDRFEDGYGLSVEVVKKAISSKADLIITVDNGISAIEAVEFAKQANLPVIITDHHLCPNPLPSADAIINPNLPDCTFPSKNLAGVGVTFYLMLALRAKLRQEKWFNDNQLAEFNIANLLDLVALGTIADVVKLDHNNRILVHQGVSRIRFGYCCEGIKALLQVAKKDCCSCNATDLAFYIAPRLNAAGRMDNMSLGVELLLCDHPDTALNLATDLNNLNNDRKLIEQTMHQEALSFIEKMENEKTSIPHFLVVYHPEWHQGIIGILSSRLKEKYHRPVISFASTQDGFLKGSGRSIKGIHLRDLLDELQHLHPELMVSFGGHAMAVGLTIHENDLSRFTACVEALLLKRLDDKLLETVIETDGEIDGQDFNYSIAKQLKDSGPWGEGFPEPIFDGEFIIHQQRLLADKHLKLVLEPKNGGPIIDGIAFNVDRLEWPDLSIKQAKLVYHLDVDEFRGNQAAKLLIRHLWPIA
ncbi:MULTISPECIES: single-stranded-DNA-specific exonuclease RecJ [unclassified Gilliamella]|uniref:single-stranded-DNA-specific exonuclease RecJ n=1 Tax=unclassified Gilliamella TaxID=2685620 RepID=UPI002269DCD4|nr:MULTISPECIES: single-stranded-DNA-specific exonuclease RecJ [unclassified Gilliamella]MCX8575318.1 single-stranded-DNA-specific exonuclease RecJ [Gilliamella sp. B3831]MCX8577638.1 single-stranded-DNA-specific exonuclease RecJ [Gilliamella sp. B3815]MCX8589733.1 single-stranded-DNA-specific exonuclease RecJ [Gilliamella sp. B3812]MCX8604685.1 single-stranded-DNA-specific exonuclease RecJ [Gilliamella sp. B3823]MCX8606428.1 single-stranded-DNA-specific exonuclease RecJ [Gilliamella sp. B3825